MPRDPPVTSTTFPLTENRSSFFRLVTLASPLSVGRAAGRRRPFVSAKYRPRRRVRANAHEARSLFGGAPTPSAGAAPIWARVRGRGPVGRTPEAVVGFGVGVR